MSHARMEGKEGKGEEKKKDNKAMATARLRIHGEGLTITVRNT